MTALPSDPKPASPWLPIITAALLAPAFLVKVKSYDVWWHLATGRWIAEHKSLPTTDPFTYTMAGKPWHFVNGLAEVLFYGAHRAGGDDAIVLLKVLCAFATLALVGLSVREISARRGTVVALVAATAILVHGRYTMDRPMIMGAVLLAASVLAVLRSLRRRDRFHLFFLVALPLWPLIHGTGLLGFAALGALLVAAHLDGSPRRRVAEIAAVLLACLALSLVLPWWRGLYFTAAGLGGGATATKITAEWRSGADAVSERLGHWAIVLGALAGGVLHIRRNAALLLLSLAGAAISAQFARNAYEGVILAMPAFACALEALSARLRAHGTELLERAAPLLVALALCVVQFSAAPQRTIGGPFGLGVDRRLFPYDTLATLRTLPVHRLFNDFPLGGFLIWENGPWGVYCDGRTVALYGEEDVRRLIVPMLESSEALTRAADQWQAVYGLNENASAPNAFMMTSPDWVPLHIGLGTTLFIRSTHLDELPPDVKPLTLLRFTVDPEWVRAWYLPIVKNPKLRRALAEQLATEARLSPESPVLAGVIRAVAAIDPPYAAALEATVIEARGGG